MKIHLVYASPNGTTRTTVREIAKAFEGHQVEEHDLTLQANGPQERRFVREDLVVLGLPSAGMLYGRVHNVFDRLRGDGTPLVGVVLYGNAYYGVALKQMRKLAEQRGFIPVALGAFIGQHALSSEIAMGRPDETDRAIQREFGRRVHEKVFPKQNLNMASREGTGWSGSIP